MKVIVIGDIILDINYFSIIERNCPENNKIPINKIIHIEYILGGASNVSYNLNSLNVDVELIGIVGNDNSSFKVNELLIEKNIKNKIFIDFERKTTVKNRIFIENELFSRYDIEDVNEINELLENQIINYIFNISEKIDAIILCDYDKGFLTTKLTQQIINYCNENNIFSFIDPKIKNYQKYKNCFLIKPNHVEAENMTNETNLELIFEKINYLILPKHILLTRGKNGMILDNLNSEHIIHENLINVVDVTGAGDISMSVLVYMFLKTNNLYYSAKVSNYISGISTTVVGNYNILNHDIINNYLLNMFGKNIYDYETEKINFIINFYKNSNLKIVFTNGCFDILHSGHIRLLQYAKNQGDILIVGLNSDESIKNIKGNERPINDINERKTILSLFSFIDCVITFNDSTPLEIIKQIKPNLIIKGGDYNENNIIGKEYCDEVLIFNYIENKSSTNIINKIKSIT
jgi:D-beta-D-heptose 7-phosphate kinase/D-beta-D-heptose 1-phosphate adenosyltransferase